MLYLTKLRYYNQVYLSVLLFGSVSLPAALIGRGFGGAQVYTPWSEGSIALLQTESTHPEYVCKGCVCAAVYLSGTAWREENVRHGNPEVLVKEYCALLASYFPSSLFSQRSLTLAISGETV